MATKPRKRDQFKSLFYHDEARASDSSLSSAAATPATSENDTLITGESSDSQRAHARYIDAAKLLERAIKDFAGTRKQQFEFPELKGEPDFNDVAFRKKFNTALETFKPSGKNIGTWGKCTHALQSLFTALSPFAKNFLTIAIQGAAVFVNKRFPPLTIDSHFESVWVALWRPHAFDYCVLCRWLSLMAQKADQELLRKEELDNALDYFAQQLEELEVVTVLPEEIEQRDYVLNRALDVRSASMMYLAVLLHHNSTVFGTPGRVFKTFFIGDEKITNSEKYLNTSIASFTRALNSIHTRVSIKSYELLKGLAALTAQQKGEERRPLEDKFMVPYQQNPHFTGRTTLLQTLKEKLLTEQPKHFNHRVALYGIGGVGKTQCALEYVYSNRDVYDRIYWISATSQSSLLSGFQKIAKKAQLPGLENGNSQEIAESVLAWLRSEKNWLIVIDNLDDITVVDGFLPENGPQKHTLITTRNPNTLGIPAEPLEVTVLTTEDSIDLLSTLSLVPITPDSPEWAKAAEIVKALGYLPLAIEQAAAYVREISGDLNSYYQEWLENHKELNSWVPSGNRQYSYSVATTWSMSFNVVRTSNPSAARMLRLFSVLNPDGILIPFLLDGVEGAEEELKTVFLNRLEMAKALLELERFSLIKWDRLGKTLSIHRLIQAVVADEMAFEEFEATYLTVVDMCFYAFPMTITPETRPICRRYESQVVFPINDLLGVTNEHMYSLRYRVAMWFHDQGKYKDAEAYYRQLIAMTKRGPMDAPALNNLIIYMDNLAGSYLNSGRLEDSARLREAMMENRKHLTGEDDPATLTAINNLALTYMYQGRIDESRTLQEELVQKANKILGPDNRETLIFTDNLALSYVKAKRYDEAAKLQREALERSRKAYGDEDELTLAIGHNLAMTYKRDGRLSEAVEMLRKILSPRERVLGEDHPDTLTSKHLLANSLRELEKPEEALPLAEEVLEKRAKALGEKHASTINSMGLLILLYRELGKVSDSEAMEKRVLNARE